MFGFKVPCQLVGVETQPQRLKTVIQEKNAIIMEVF